MTRKLYYEDPYQTSFQAEILKVTEEYCVLSATAFYPTGGGQPHDVGKINGVEVINVEEVDGEIRHFLKSPIQIDKSVEGRIDWEHRFDHMQQHLGQHILSAAFAEVTSYETIGFHLGSEIVTIDLDVETIQNDQLAEVEKRANEIILANHPVLIEWVTKEEAAKYPLRKELTVDENIRLVIIPGIDYNGCGGTHPRSTAEVQGMKIVRFERQKQKVRVEFVCGNRILQQLHQKTEVITNLKKQLNAPMKKLGDAASVLLDRNKQLEKEKKRLTEVIQGFEAKSLLQTIKMISDRKIVSYVFSNKTVVDMQKLAKTLITQDPEVTVFFASESTEKVPFVFCQGEESNLHLKQLTLNLLLHSNGKGGGTDQQMQGTVDANLYSADEWIQAAISEIR